MALLGEADRDRALALLRRHYAEGRFDHEELGRRADVALRARSSADVWLALRGLPNAVFETLVAPRALAAGTALAGHSGLHRAKRLAWAAVISFVWMFLTTLLLLAYAISLIASGPSLLVAVVFAASWLLVSWGSWRAWRRRTRRA